MRGGRRGLRLPLYPGLDAAGTSTLHATAGLEVRSGASGIYGEKPYTLPSAPILALKVRSGVNFYF
jgi:hypothetical protein